MHKSMRSLLLALTLYSIYVIAQTTEHECIATSLVGFSPEQFYSDPQNITLEYCEMDSGKSCCSRQYSDLVGQYRDPFSFSFSSVVQSPTGTCREKLNGISCILCSTAQTDWILVQPESSSLWMCQSYCDDLYTECGNEIDAVNGTVVSQSYPTSTDFCNRLFSQISGSVYAFHLLLDQRTTQCWDGLRECTIDDYYYVYTSCTNNQRTRVYYKKPEVECNGGTSLPPPTTNLPCAMSCSPGQISGISSCLNCPRGFYSLGGTLALNTFNNWTQVNEEIPFETYCTHTDQYGVEHTWTESECGWELEGMQIASPRSLNDSMSAYLETSVTLIDAGLLQFICTVDSEATYDGLKIYIDRTQVGGLIFGLSSFTTFNVSLTAGYHFIQFVYFKDGSVSRGADQAVINFIAITKVNYAADSCDPCAPGTYTNHTGSAYCTKCPLNTYADRQRSTSCSPCPDDQYALEGSSGCTPKPPCGPLAFYYLYGPCFYDEATQSLKRQRYAVWTDPHICSNDTVLPGPTYEDCAPCGPGQFRSENNANCTFCPTGYANANGQGSECTSCGAGFEAIKSIYFTFDAFEYGLTTNCSYNCGSDGWQMRGPMVDSGTGHGSYVVSTLHLEQNFSEPGNITFRYSLNCTQGCTLSFTSDIPTLNYRAYGGSLNIFTPTNVPFTGQVPAGTHWFNWQFTKNDPFGIAPYDRAIINQLTITHTEIGGAPSCTLCPSGHYQPNSASSYCIEAQPGFYAPPGSIQQYPCSGPQDYTNVPGSASCKQCGENVNANSDHTGCDITCSFNDNGVLYDLSPLQRADGEMYGPVFEPIANSNNTNIYYVNMCTLTHNARVCFDTHNNTIDTYACQVTPLGIGEDLGSIFGILPLDNTLGDFQNYSRSDLGVTVHLTGGAQCHNGSLYFDRQTFIHVVCNENAGVGQVQPLIYGHVEAPKCVYNFYWESLYGCPVCTANDYYFYTTECDSNTGYKLKKYEWTLNPKKCHSGVSLPADERILCNSNIYCPEGQYVDSDRNVCAYAQPGFYSVGNGIDINDWISLETGFTTNGWVSSVGSIASGVGDTSLLYVHEFVTAGYVDYTYYVNTYGDSTAGLSVFLDDVLVGSVIRSTNDSYLTDRITIPMGYHYIKFLFQGGTATTTDSRGRGANIKNMRIVGIVKAADYPIPCAPGYISDTVGATSCRQCPANTLSSSSRTSCEPCSSSYYSLPGSASCTIRPQCQDSDYVAVYGACYNNQQVVSRDLITPSVCLALTNVNNSTIIDCTPCEEGLYRDPNSSNGIQACLACGAGSYWSEEAQDCVTARVGHAAVSERSYFTQPIPGSDFPAEFSTGCKGDCVCVGSENACNDGWIFLGDRAISGRNPGQGVDTFLKLVITLDYPGSVEFQYDVSGPSDNGLEFYINDKASIIPYHPASDAKSASSTTFDLEQGYNELVWNYHQVPNTMGEVSLSNILISGVGGAVGDTVCAAGQYSNTTGASYCSDCVPGTANPTAGASVCNTCDGNNYSDLPGATSCKVCGENTVANDLGTDCVTNCTYTFGNSTYDITPLRDSHGPYPLTSTDDDLWVNLCQKASSNVICIDPTGDSINTYVCAVNTRGAGTDMGHKLAVTQRSDSAILFTFTEAQTAHCDTQIALICSVSEMRNSMPVEAHGSTSCNLRLEWNTPFACPLCTQSDYEPQESKCENGEKTINYVRKNACYGPELLDSTQETCPKTYSVPLAVIIVIVAVFVILILIVAGVFLYSRRIRNQYIALVKQSDGQYEMKNMEDTSVSTEKSEAEPKAKEDTV